MFSQILSVKTVRRLGGSTFNYWAGYVVNLSLVAWLLAHAFAADGVSLLTLRGWGVAFIVGMGAWSYTEYAFHRFIYHEIKSFLQIGHDLHHKEPKAYIGVPWYFTAAVLIGIYYGLARFFGPAWTGSVMGF